MSDFRYDILGGDETIDMIVSIQDLSARIESLTSRKKSLSDEIEEVVGAIRYEEDALEDLQAKLRDRLLASHKEFLEKIEKENAEKTS